MVDNKILFIYFKYIITILMLRKASSLDCDIVSSHLQMSEDL